MGYGGDAKSLPHFSPSLVISSQVCILRRPPDSSQLQLFQFTITITASYLLTAFSFRCLRLI